LVLNGTSGDVTSVGVFNGNGSGLSNVVASAVLVAVTNQWNADILGATNKLNTDLRAALAQTNQVTAGVSNQWRVEITGATNKLDTDLRAALAQTNATLYASNLVSGGQIPVGTLFDYTTTNEPGWLLVTSSGTRHRTFDGGSLTGILASALSYQTVTTNNAVLSSGRLQVGNGARGVQDATASGAVSINADGTATTLAQLQTLGCSNLCFYKWKFSWSNSFRNNNELWWNVGRWYCVSLNLATGNWVTITNGNITLGPTNAVAKITLNGTSGDVLSSHVHRKRRETHGAQR